MLLTIIRVISFLLTLRLRETNLPITVLESIMEISERAPLRVCETACARTRPVWPLHMIYMQIILQRQPA